MEITFEQYEDNVFKRNKNAPFIGMFEYIDNPILAKQHDALLFKDTLVQDFGKEDTSILRSHGYITFPEAQKILKDGNFPYQSDTNWKSELIASAISKTGETFILDKIHQDEYHVLVNKVLDMFYVKHVWYNRNRRRGYLGYHTRYHRTTLETLNNCLSIIK